MLLDFYRKLADSARESLTECGSLEKVLMDKIDSLFERNNNLVENIHRTLEVIDSANKECKRMTNIIDNVASQYSGTWEKLVLLEREHQVSSDTCNELREIANEHFKKGDVPQGKMFRDRSIESKDRCVELQREIASLASQFDRELENYGADFTYESFCKQMKTLRKSIKKICILQDRLDSLTEEAERLTELRKLFVEQYEICMEQFNDAWDGYKKVALAIGHIPDEYGEDAKVTYSAEDNQTKIIFGEKPDGTHGHVQINNMDDEIIYYRLPGEKHGRQNYMRAYRT